MKDYANLRIAAFFYLSGAPLFLRTSVKNRLFSVQDSAFGLFQAVFTPSGANSKQAGFTTVFARSAAPENPARHVPQARGGGVTDTRHTHRFALPASR